MDLIHRSLLTDDSCFHFRNETWQYLSSQGNVMLQPAEHLSCASKVAEQVSLVLCVHSVHRCVPSQPCQLQPMVWTQGQPVCWSDYGSCTQRSYETQSLACRTRKCSVGAGCHSPYCGGRPCHCPLFALWFISHFYTLWPEYLTGTKRLILAHDFRGVHSLISGHHALGENIMASGGCGKRQLFTSLKQEARARNVRFLPAFLLPRFVLKDLWAGSLSLS